MGKQIILIVIDGLSWKPLMTHINKLPAFKSLLKYKHGSMINEMETSEGRGYPITLTSFCAATSLWTGKTPKEHGMLKDAWYKEQPKINKPNYSREDVKAKFIWEEIPNSIALHTLFFPMLCYNCKLENPIFNVETKIRFPFNPKLRFSFPARTTMALTKQSVQILRDRNPPFFTCGLYGLDTPSHYNWNAHDGFKDLYEAYKWIDKYLQAIMPFLKKSWFMITTQHGMDDWYITSLRKTGRPQGHKGIHGDHDEACPYFTNMEEPKSILDVYPIIIRYAKKEGII